MFNRKKLTRAEKKDLRDTTSLLISAAGLGVSVAALALTLNRKPLRCMSCKKMQRTSDGRILCSRDRFNRDNSLHCIQNNYSGYVRKR